MGVARFCEDSTNVRVGVSVDAGAFGTATATGSDINAEFNRIAIGKNAHQTDNVDVFTGKLVALFVYLDQTTTTWNQSFVTAVLNSGDPWAFLDTGGSASKNLLLMGIG